MTKVEKSKLDYVCDLAIKDMKEANALYEKLNKPGHIINLTESERMQRQADQKYGFALGINEVLARVGYDNKEKMKILSSMI